MHVLIIDDDPAYLSACATVLRDDGHDVSRPQTSTKGDNYLRTRVASKRSSPTCDLGPTRGCT